jgi:hypothetical protein
VTKSSKFIPSTICPKRSLSPIVPLTDIIKLPVAFTTIASRKFNADLIDALHFRIDRRFICKL